MNKDNQEQENKDTQHNHDGCEDCDCDCEEEGTEELQQKIEELEENWKRALADYQNLQKRVAKERRQVIDFANSVLIMKLFPVLDNLETMAKHSDEEGLEMIIKEFKRVLTEEGVEEIEAESEEFDPETMEAIESVEGEPGKVMEVTRKGYRYKNKVLRPAEVKVGHTESEDK